MGLHRILLAGCWLVIAVAGAQGQSRPVIQTAMPEAPAALESSGHSFNGLEPMTDFDGLGLSNRPVSAADDPRQKLRDIVDAAIAFEANDYTNALGSLTGWGEPADNCNYFDELLTVAESYEKYDGLLIEGVKAGVLPLDALAGEGSFSGQTVDGTYVWYQFGMSRENALAAIAKHPGVSRWLAEAASGTAKFERLLAWERQLIQALKSYCKTPQSRFEFAGNYGTDQCKVTADPAWFVQNSALVPREAFAFLASVNVKDFYIQCARVEMAGAFLSLGRLIFEDVSLDTLELKKSTIQQLQISRSSARRGISLDDSAIQNGVTIDDLQGDGSLSLQYANVRGRVEVKNSAFAWISTVGATLDQLRISDSQLTAGLYLQNATFTDGLDFKGVEVLGPTYFNRSTSGGMVRIERGAFGAPLGPTGKPGNNEVSFASAQLDAGLVVLNTRMTGDLMLNHGRYASVGLYNVHVGGQLNLFNAAVDGSVLLGGPEYGMVVGGQLSTESLKAESLELAYAQIGGLALMHGMQLNGHLSVSSTAFAGNVNLNSVAADTVSLYSVGGQDISLSGGRIAGALQATNLLAHSVTADHLAAGYVQLNSVKRDRAVPAVPFVMPTSEGRCFDAAAIPAAAPDALYLSRESRRALGLSPASDGAAAPLGCVERINLAGANVGGDLTIEGSVLRLVDLSTASIKGQLMLAGSATWFGDRSCVSARGMRVDSIIYDLQPEGAARGPQLVDFYGTDFRMLRGSQPSVAGRASWEDVNSYLSRFLGSRQQSCDLDAGLVRDENQPGGREYQPALYDALAAGLERSGDLDQARKVRIVKNRDYADTLVLQGNPLEQITIVLTRTVYWLADQISGYGYDNLKAVIWLGGFTGFGLILGLIGEARIAQVLDPLLGRGGAVKAATPAPKRNAKGQYTGVWAAPVPATRRPGLFFSIDRSVPSLALDEAFARHEGLGQYLSIWFYLQRLICFLILLLMVAGAFNVFQ